MSVQRASVTYGTDCYPRKALDTWIRLEDLNEAVLFNMRNAYQNYNVAVNLSDRVLYTYMGVLQPKMRNATYSTSGQLSPLLNDPLYRTIGMGTRIFLGGGIGYVVGSGTQHNPGVVRNDRGVPRTGAGTLAVTGDLKGMNARWLRGASFTGYGTTLAVGIGFVSLHSTLPLRGTEISPTARGKAFALFAFSLFVGSAVGTAVLGRLVDAGNYEAVFTLAGAGLIAIGIGTALSPSRPPA